MTPKDIQRIGEELAISWLDGHETYLKLEELRRHCPCAGCQGEPDVLGRVHRGPPPTLTPESFQLVSIQAVGGYAIQPVWQDGHHSGIYSFSYLRSLCPCDECAKARQQAG
ncbi:MAG: DUF971 domain-containing protein [Verrucomicrobia bacterium]|nr:DUF971 domain-containing protein [Verrucomicrobiota bacterium]